VGLDTRRSIFSPSATETFFASVLQNRMKSADEIRAYQKTFNVKLYDYLRIISIEVIGRKWHPDYLFYLLKVLKNHFSRSIVILVNTMIVVLYDSREINKTESPSFIERLTPVLERNSCHASVSLPFEELSDIPQYYEQTLECLKVGNVLHRHDPILYYQNLIEYHMILSFSRRNDVERLIHPTVRKLMQVDRLHEGDLTRTLFAYLDNQQSVAATARALSVHYNTLKYRIKRITEVVDIDFSDGDQMFRIALSKRALEVLEATESRK
jgi:sugar diacid utilization regulator